MTGKRTNKRLQVLNSRRRVSLYLSSLLSKQKYFSFHNANRQLPFISSLSNEYSSEKNKYIYIWKYVPRLFVTSHRREQNHRDCLNKTEVSGGGYLLPSRLPPSPVPAPPSVTRQYWT